MVLGLSASLYKPILCLHYFREYNILFPFLLCLSWFTEWDIDHYVALMFFILLYHLISVCLVYMSFCSFLE